MCASAWHWDPTLYAGSAPFYAAGRTPYPPHLASAVRNHVGLDGTGRLLDVGCGPGSLTLLLAPLFEEAVGVDADPGMIDAATGAGAGNVAWQCLRAEDLPGALGTFRVVSFAQSFHWVDRPVVARAVRRMLEPSGALVLVNADTAHQHGHGDESALPYPAPPRDAIAALVTRYLGEVRRAGRGVLPAGLPAISPEVTDEQALTAAGFTTSATFVVRPEAAVEVTEDQLVAAVFSLSSATPQLLGPSLPAFEGDLRALLRSASAAGRFSEWPGDIKVSVFRP